MLGTNGCVLVNALDSEDSAKEALGAFRHVTDKPIVAILLTSFDRDHISGVNIFAKSARHIKLIFHENFTPGSFFEECKLSLTRKVVLDGEMLENDKHFGTGIGKPSSKSYQWANHIIDPDLELTRFQDKMDLKVAGLDLELIYCPGDSDDHCVLWWPEKKALFSGRNIYRSLPNFHGLKGGQPRNILFRVDALSKMIDLKPEILIPSYTRPSANAEEVSGCLQAHRDMLQLLHDQTVRFMNKGKVVVL